MTILCITNAGFARNPISYLRVAAANNLFFSVVAR